MAEVFVPPSRGERWTENFASRHGPTTYAVEAGALVGTAADGSTFEARLPFGRPYDGSPTPASLAAGAVPPDDWGLLLVRKGGFAAARVSGSRIGASKVGRRHVQGRTKAGGQSQQRFARRRDNQARDAYLAAAGHAHRLLEGVTALVTGGDREALRAVLAETALAPMVVATLPDVPEPRRDVLVGALRDACALRVRVHNADG